MKPKAFHIPTTWRVKGTVEEVYKILSTPTDFVRWWPSVYIEVSELKAGDEDGIGRVVRLRTKGKLPYTLGWQAEAVEIEKPHRIRICAQGDLEGCGEWQFSQEGEWVTIRYNWIVYATKPWMNVLAPVLKPIFVWNHLWAMRQGEIGLRRELSHS